MLHPKKKGTWIFLTECYTREKKWRRVPAAFQGQAGVPLLLMQSTCRVYMTSWVIRKLLCCCTSSEQISQLCYKSPFNCMHMLFLSVKALFHVRLRKTCTCYNLSGSATPPLLKCYFGFCLITTHMTFAIIRMTTDYLRQLFIKSRSLV